MMVFPTVWRYLVLLVVVLCRAASAAPEVAPVEIVSAEFGRFEAGEQSNETVFVPTTVVPHRQGQRYGWVIEVRHAPRSLSVREEYLIAQPSAPTDADKTPEANPGGLRLVPPRRNQVSQRQLVPVDNRIYGEWAIGPGEPAGRRKLQVIIEEQQVASFDFEVRAVPDSH